MPPETSKGQPGWPMTTSTDARHWLDTALTGPRRTLLYTTRPLWATLKRSPGAVTAWVSFTPQTYAQNSSSRGGHGHQSMQWVCCHQGSTCQDRNRNHAGSSTRTSASCGGVDTSIFAPSAASHTRWVSVQSPLPAWSSPGRPGIGPQDSNTRNTGDWEPVSDLERTGRAPDLSPALSHWFHYIQLWSSKIIEEYN